MDRSGGCFVESIAPHPTAKVMANGMMHSNNKNNNQSDTCRDFLRNVCTRGNKCKFYHPKGKEDAIADKNVKEAQDGKEKGLQVIG